MNEYKIISPPFTLKFREMSKKELEDYNKWFLTQIPERILILEKAINSVSGFENWKADFSPESLDKLGEWFSMQIETRKRTEDEMSRKTANLSWPANQIEIPNWELTNKTFSIAIDIGMYLSQVFLKNISHLKWQFKTTGRKDWIDYGQPVLASFGSDVFNPVQMMVTVAYGIARGKIKGSRVRQLYVIWKKLAGP